MAALKGFYLDENMPRAVAEGLIERGYQTIMAHDVGMRSKDDDTEHLPYAIQHELVMVTLDHPFAGRSQNRSDHPGLICISHSIRTDIGEMILLLGEFAELYDSDQDAGKVYWLP
jgi:predicted nuclease of predicted toxin-antitoxin system